MLATCVRSKPREGIDFFPLTIDVEERAYAAGQDPRLVLPARRPARRDRDPHGSPDRPARCARPSRKASATRSRSSCTVLSVDMANPYDIPAMNAAAVRRRPRRAAVRRPGRRRAPRPDRRRVGRQPDLPGDRGRDVRHRRRGLQERRRRRRHPDDRGRGARATRGRCSPAARSAPTEEVVAQGLEVAKTEIAKIIAFQEEFIAAHGVTRDGVRRPPRSTATTSGTTLYANFAGKLEAAIVPDQAGARRGVRRGQGRGEGPPGRRRWARRPSPSARQRVRPRLEVPAEEGHAPARGRAGRPARRPRRHRHPAAVGRGRRVCRGPTDRRCSAGATPRC